MKYSYRIGKALLIVTTLFTLAACASHVKRGDEYAAQDEWTKAILEYRQAHHEDPSDIEIKSHMMQMELKAANHYYHRGAVTMAKGDLDGAIELFQQGLVAMP